MSSALKIDNSQARNLAIHYAGLTHTPNGPCNPHTLLSTIESLGYVQLDPLSVIARAHDHILWSRHNQYRPHMLEQLMHDQHIFEHFSHDACVLPMQILPYWKRQFKQQSEKRTSAQWRTSIKRKDQQLMIKRLKNEGALRSIDFKNDISIKNDNKSKQVWTKPEHKKLLDYLWLKGDLAVSKRHNFTKYYDLAERIYPEQSLKLTTMEQIDWLSVNALSRLGFATPSEVMRFWEACSLTETKSWCSKNTVKLKQIEVESFSGDFTEAIASTSQLATLKQPPKPTQRLRIINPFDPLVRDRKRLARLFGFDYKIEIYVPPKKRLYGYYVYPILEFNRFVGRIEVKHDSDKNILQVDKLWPENGIKFGKERMKKLTRELERMRHFCQAENIVMNSIAN